MNLADATILLIILVSVLVSVMRGFVKEILSLVAWVAAFWAAATFAVPVSTALEPHIDIPTLRIVLAFVGVMVVTLIVVGLINYLIARLLESTGLSGTDRMLGALFGFARGAAVVIVAVLVGGLTAAPAKSWWQESQAIVPFEIAAVHVLRYLPPEFSKHFSF